MMIFSKITEWYPGGVPYYSFTPGFSVHYGKGKGLLDKYTEIVLLKVLRILPVVFHIMIYSRYGASRDLCRIRHCIFEMLCVPGTAW